MAMLVAAVGLAAAGIMFTGWDWLDPAVAIAVSLLIALGVGLVRDWSIGQLLLDGGVHQGRQVAPREWVRRMQQPCAVAPFYGWLTWLNRDGRLFADASRSSWFMFGAGGHLVWIDPDNEAVVVARWLDGAHFVGRTA